MILVSVRTMSWSLKPGIDLHLLTSVGLLVMKMSSVFFDALERLPLLYYIGKLYYHAREMVMQ